jgi:serine/threonine protein kinase
VGREFAAVLDRMTRCNPSDRYQSVDAVLKDIARLPKLSTNSPRITDDRITPKFRISRLLFPSAIALFVLAIGIYLFNITKNPVSEGSQSSINSVIPSPIPSNVNNSIPIENPPRENKASYNQLSIYLKDKDWKAADYETYLLLLKAAGRQSSNDGTWHPDEFNRITCADLALIDQLWTQASNGNQGLTAQKKIYEDSTKDIRKAYESMGWISLTGEVAIATAYNRQTSRWEYIEGRQPNFKTPPVGHLPFLLRDPTTKNLERMVILYRCSK